MDDEILLIPWEGQQSLLETHNQFGKISVEIPPPPNIQGILEEIWDGAIRNSRDNPKWLGALLQEMGLRREILQHPYSTNPTDHSPRSGEGSERKTGQTPTTE